MSDESPNDDQAWWMPADRPEPAEPEDLIELGRLRPTRPIGPVSLRSWSRRPYVLAGVAVAALLGGAGAALAVSNSSPPTASPSATAASPAPSPAPSRPSGPGFHRFGPGGFGFGFGGGLFGALHGQLVVRKPGGGYQTVDVQDGQVTAVSSTSITLKSADGFTKTYAVTSSTLVDAQRDGIGSVKVGNQAAVLATVSGSAVTATSISDLTLQGQGHAGFGFGRGPSGAPAPQTG
jgi:hypothetical protein